MGRLIGLGFGFLVVYFFVEVLSTNTTSLGKGCFSSLLERQSKS